MESIISENNQKYLNYREQFKRLKKALDQQFYLEAIFIEYAIMEDRTESVLRHADKWDTYLKSRKGHEPNLDSKVRCIAKLAEQKKTLLNKYFSDNLLDSVMYWKGERNRMIHALMKQSLTTDDLASLAEQGRVLARNLTNRVGYHNRVAARRRHVDDASD